MEGNQYRCEKCNQTFDNYLNIIMLQFEVADFTGTVWLTMFDELVARTYFKINFIFFKLKYYCSFA
jgi:hypothetical protein